jgi:hypothetical protein
MCTNKFTNHRAAESKFIKYLAATKIIVSLLLATSLLTAQPLAAFSWGIGGYLASAYSTATGCAEQLKSNFKVVATTAVLSVTVGHAIGSSKLTSSALIAVAGLLACYTIYNHWDQAEKCKAELENLKAKSSDLKLAQETQIRALSAAKEKAEENTGAAESLKASIAEQTGQVTGLGATITGNTAELGKINQAVADTSAAIATSLNATKEAAIGQVKEHITKLTGTIEAQVDTVAKLNTQATTLSTAQADCTAQVTAASKQLETTNAELRKLTDPTALSPVGAPVSIIHSTSPVNLHALALATPLPAD